DTTIARSAVPTYVDRAPAIFNRKPICPYRTLRISARNRNHQVIYGRMEEWNDDQGPQGITIELALLHFGCTDGSHGWFTCLKTIPFAGILPLSILGMLPRQSFAAGARVHLSKTA